MKELLDRIKGKRVLVVGDVMLDHKVTGEVNRISPEAPVPLLRIYNEQFQIGGAGNVASNIISLGGEAILVGTAGTDKYAKILEDIANSKGIKTIFVLDREVTTLKSRYYSGNHYLFRADSELTHEITEEIEQEIINKLQKETFDIIVVSDYNKGIVTEGLISKLKMFRKKIVMDPKPVKIDYYKGVDYITPNLKELGQISSHYGLLTPAENNEEYLKKSLDYLKQKIETTIITTRSEKGISYLENDKIITIPIVEGKVYDVTGAGDSTIAALSLCLAAGENLNNACLLGVLAGCSAVRHSGTIAVTKNTIIEEYEKNSQTIQVKKED